MPRSKCQEGSSPGFWNPCSAPPRTAAGNITVGQNESYWRLCGWWHFSFLLKRTFHSINKPYRLLQCINFFTTALFALCGVLLKKPKKTTSLCNCSLSRLHLFASSVSGQLSVVLSFNRANNDDHLLRLTLSISFRFSVMLSILHFSVLFSLSLSNSLFDFLELSDEFHLFQRQMESEHWTNSTSEAGLVEEREN